jgi:hypothetical protein
MAEETNDVYAYPVPRNLVSCCRIKELILNLFHKLPPPNQRPIEDEVNRVTARLERYPGLYIDPDSRVWLSTIPFAGPSLDPDLQSTLTSFSEIRELIDKMKSRLPPGDAGQLKDEIALISRFLNKYSGLYLRPEWGLWLTASAPPKDWPPIG